MSIKVVKQYRSNRRKAVRRAQFARGVQVTEVTVAVLGLAATAVEVGSVVKAKRDEMAPARAEAKRIRTDSRAADKAAKEAAKAAEKAAKAYAKAQEKKAEAAALDAEAEAELAALNNLGNTSQVA
jgi:membrane protein involved in colicin uptake